MQITTEMIKELRQATSAGVLDCKKALEQSAGDFGKAVEILREKGLAVAAKKAGRETKEGLIGSYIHAGGKIAALIEVNCETDFVARTEEFQTFVHDLAMQVVAARPLYLRPEDVPAEVLENKKRIYRIEAEESGRSAQVVDRIVEGKVAQYYEDTCLLEQAFIKEPAVKIKDLLAAKIAQLGENIIIRRFVRYELGESLE